ncbi:MULTISPECIES: L,D-transpeptidase family protein [Calditerrivibrio]|uniref:L,D-transpeptidase family protein n=1 Tax=Calditerrivibrio TaxID=545865 RepID=UPI003C77C519
MEEIGSNMIKIIRIFLSLTLLVVCYNSVYAYKKIFADVMSKGVDKEKVFLVDKGMKKSFLVEIRDDVPILINEFDDVIVGEANGDKLREGDKKTPTGVYYVVGFIPPSKLDKIYGSGAFPLNYPNFVDKLYGKTGHGIWIHGRDPHEKKQASKGCVVLKNENIDYLKSINFINTPVVIAEKLHFTDELNYNTEKIFWLNFLNEFYESWKNNDINKLSKLIHVRFKDSNHKSYSEYIQRKKMLMEKYPQKTIVFENIKIFKENDSEVVFDFDQYYSAPNITTYGTKRLYLIKEANDFKIIAEEYIPKAIPDRYKHIAKPEVIKTVKPIDNTANYEKPTTPIVKTDNEATKQVQTQTTAPKDNNTNIEKTINDFVEEWRLSWESKDINRYIDFYSLNFKSGGLDYEGWKSDKGGKFERIKNISVVISNIKIEKLKNGDFNVTFVQRYKTETMNNKGVKTLTIRIENGKPKIIGESWRPLK